MNPTVSLAEFVRLLEAATIGDSYGLNLRTGEFHQRSEPTIAPEPTHPATGLRHSGELVPLPAWCSEEESSARKRFCRSLQDRAVRDAVLARTGSHDSAEAFEDAVFRYKIAGAWFRFRSEALEQFAARWLESRGIAYTRDSP